MVMWFFPGRCPYVNSNTLENGEQKKVLFGYYDQPQSGLPGLKAQIQKHRHALKKAIIYASTNSDKFEAIEFEYPENNNF
jgi:hypothetical protein